ncbi:MAG: sigma 54-interacting transcriptional regulator [Candidatus Sumerlaeia bacterium]|nr:sigma 54-interacting transcriptional regulator [Candidatus Sumerlaeia bacterium]
MASLPAFLELVVRSGAKLGAVIPLDRPVLFGRDPRSRFEFEDPQVSRLHCLIEPEEDRALVRDLGSRNGVFVNEVRIRAQEELHPGDLLRVGQTEFLLRAARPERLIAGSPQRDDATSEMQATTDGAPAPAYQEEPSNPGSTSGVSLPGGLLSRAIEFALECGGFSRRHQLVTDFLPQAQRLFDASSSVFWLQRPQRSTVVLSSQFDVPCERLLEGVPWKDRGAERQPMPDAPGGAKSLLRIRLLSLEGSVLHLILCRGAEAPFTLAEEHVGRAMVRALRRQRVQELFRHLVREHEMIGTGDVAFVGHSLAMARVRDELRKLAPVDSTVLVRGESGTGKELAAQALVSLSGRRGKPFVALNAAALPRELMEAELFGYEKGAFTGAEERRLGKLELANGGTVFLDEIGDLPLDLQAKLLRLLDRHPFYRIGGKEEVRVDVRFLCATHQPLEQMVSAGLFREDLFHRINILSVELPPLRERLEDIPELAAHFLDEIAHREGFGRRKDLSAEALACLMRHHWPGNVRELRNVLERMCLTTPEHTLELHHVPTQLRPVSAHSTAQLSSLAERTSELERREVLQALVESKGVKSRAAQLLGLSRPTLDKKIKQYGLDHLASRRFHEEAAARPGDVDEDPSPPAGGV